jgi:hypothetical protein
MWMVLIFINAFHKKEMDDVIMSMPMDRAPGPDGYNEFF